MKIIKHWSRNNSPIHVSARALIQIFIDNGNYTHVIRLFKHYLPSVECRITPISESEKISDHADLVIFLTTGSLIFTDNVQDEGAFSIQTGKFRHYPALSITGGSTSGVIYAVNELGTIHFKSCDDFITIPALDSVEKPASPYRLFWTWDHSTNWFLTQNGQQDIGFCNPYLKPEDGFVQDYQRIIDFMSLNRIGGVTIYGFLRDSHGGIEAAQEICRYANERGVRILPGIGINSYGGIYWEGSHRYNLSNWLKLNPGLRAQFEPMKVFELPEFAKLSIPNTPFMDAACPSKLENHNYHIEAVQWLTETFEIGGINFETGDYGACECSECTRRRASNQQWSLEDMALLYPRLFKAAQGSKNDLWLVSEAYWDNLLDLDKLAPLASLPDEAIYQFCINRSYWYKLQKELTPDHIKQLPRSTNILRTHMGSQWQMERHQLVAKQYAEMMRLVYTNGMKGATIFGEPSAFNTVNEINYLAFARFGYDSTITWENFVAHDLGALLGGAEAAQQYLTLLAIENSAEKLKQAIGIAREFSHVLSGDMYRRWVWLQHYLFQKMESI